MYQSDIEKNTSQTILQMRDSLTINYAKEIREVLINALSSSNQLVIDHSNVTEYDLSYLQLLISLHKTASAAGKTFSLKGNDNPLFKSLIEDCGCPGYSWLTKDFINYNSRESE